jgi:carbonic anhydrase
MWVEMQIGKFENNLCVTFKIKYITTTVSRRGAEDTDNFTNALLTEEIGSMLTCEQNPALKLSGGVSNMNTKIQYKIKLPLVLVSASFLLMASLSGVTAQNQPSSDEVMKILVAGNERFAEGKPTYPHEGAVRRAEASLGQHPIATIISCSDSRVPPELLFDEGIGDLFIVRVIGNIGGADEAGSAEYGVEHLGTRLLVVLGHSQCGAVTAAVNHAELHGNIPPLIAHIAPAVKVAHRDNPKLKGEALIPEAIKANVFQSIEELFTRSNVIRAKAREGTLKVVGAIYDIKSGRVNWLGTHPRQDALIVRKAVAARSGKKH